MQQPRNANHLRTFRKRSGLSQDEIAEIVGWRGGQALSSHEWGEYELSLRKALALAQDVTSEPRWREVIEKTVASYGRLDVLVNNAGIAVPGPLLHLDTDDLRRQFEINLFGVHNVTRAFADLLQVRQFITGQGIFGQFDANDRAVFGVRYGF